MVGRFFTPRFSKAAPEEPAAPPPAPAKSQPHAKPQKPGFVNERVKLHRFLLDRLNLSMLERLELGEIRTQIFPVVRDYVRTNGMALNTPELEALVSDICDEMLGLGPLEPLLKDDTVSDVLVVGAGRVFVERRGLLEPTEVQFQDEEHLMRIVNKIVAQVGRRVDESSPLVDARLADGSRVNVAVRPVAIDGPQMSIRKFSKKPLSLDRLVEVGALARPMADLLSAAVEGKVSMIIAGGTGSGKTTMLNALSASIPSNERLVTIEDAAELQLQQPHVARLETRPPTIDGRNEIAQRDLLKNALRMRPDRIIVGEVRGGEAFDMLQAMNTGHEGSMSTVHANNPRDAISRIEHMVGMAGMPMSAKAIRSQISSAVRLFLQLNRLRDGSRRVTSVTEVTGMEGETIQMQEIMMFKKLGTDEQNKIRGEFQATGVRPTFLDEISLIGRTVQSDMFEPGVALQ